MCHGDAYHILITRPGYDVHVWPANGHVRNDPTQKLQHCLGDKCPEWSGSEVDGTDLTINYSESWFVFVWVHLRPGDNEGTIENHPGEEARVPEDGSEGDHAAHAVADQEQGKVRVLILNLK